VKAPRGRARQKGAAQAGDCRAQLAELFAYLDGDLTPARCRIIESHLQQCPCCDHLAASLRRAIGACQLVGCSRMPAAVRRKARARARALASRRQSSS
jgi:anti-sigma factor RsiW